MAINQWDKGSNNNGPNCHKKGNRVKGQPRQGKTLTEASKAYSDHITHYKKLAEERRKASPYRQEEAIHIYSRLQQYIVEKNAEDKPITVSGLILAARCSSDTWRRMQSGDYDYRLFEYIDMYNVDMDSITESLTVSQSLQMHTVTEYCLQRTAISYKSLATAARTDRNKVVRKG
ncbi:MAG: hypothetical protein V8Q42_07120 [Anaerovoracaceae bacterium]